MENTRETWDRAAGDYQDVFRLGLNDYNASLLHFWQEEGMLFPGARVIDIGCGVGKYGTYLAELGCDVTLTDISGEMLRHAKGNMAKYRNILSSQSMQPPIIPLFPVVKKDMTFLHEGI